MIRDLYEGISAIMIGVSLINPLSFIFLVYGIRIIFLELQRIGIV